MQLGNERKPAMICPPHNKEQIEMPSSLPCSLDEGDTVQGTEGEKQYILQSLLSPHAVTSIRFERRLDWTLDSHAWPAACGAGGTYTVSVTLRRGEFHSISSLALSYRSIIHTWLHATHVRENNHVGTRVLH